MCSSDLIRWQVEGEGNVSACLQWACLLCREGRDAGRMRTQIWGFAIFDKRVWGGATSVRWPNAAFPSWNNLCHRYLCLEEMVDRGKIHWEENRRRGCGLMQRVNCYPMGHVDSRAKSITRKRCVPLRLILSTCCILTISLKGRSRMCEIRHCRE